MAKKKRAGKGFFAELKLPVSTSYQFLKIRPWMWVAGAVAMLAVLLAGTADYFLRSGDMMSNGPVSTNHAGFESDCAACHGFEMWGTIPSQKCNSCHEKFGDAQGVYSFASHYVYRGNDQTRTAQPDHLGHEMDCAECHSEHLGREAEIINVPDARCEGCHFGSFHADHPEFEFEAKSLGDPGSIVFTHVKHTYKVMEDRGFTDIERACLFCHNTEPDGKNFDPIDFDLHCNGCHLKPNEGVDLLPVASGGRVGVETYTQIRSRGGAGTGWTNYVNPGEYSGVGSQVGKRPLYHQDPWVLENLRQWRRDAFGESQLADLLVASAEPSFAGSERMQRERVGELYEEALDTLTINAADLGAVDSGAIQKRLQLLDNEARNLRRQLDNPSIQLDPGQFALTNVDPRISASRLGQVDDVARKLTEGCTTKCHGLGSGDNSLRWSDRQYTFPRVQKDQNVLVRAEFDHRAHILDAGCLDCHDKIPIRENIVRLVQQKQAQETETYPDATIDRSGIQNIPAIANCRQCHSPKLSGDRCISCHFFHPNKGRRSDLLVYLE